jgi:hypothetical protein
MNYCPIGYCRRLGAQVMDQKSDRSTVDQRPWPGGALARRLIVRRYSGQKVTMIGEKGRGAHRDAHGGQRGARGALELGW